ncbi:hypothetical protein FZ983_33825 [Azospirillum sp. B21]|uniref:hypothetical protein n=1 Tax=Azospirillum sp. B21 TaxID=2607496 RepID=UPI0011EC4FFA|nr:hypothetical protein [Azospirillum sp. B21]KAA0570812.1 hypothetical protein FZ983_33825 [Azospirillum sp. B21]
MVELFSRSARGHGGVDDLLAGLVIGDLGSVALGDLEGLLQLRLIGGVGLVDGAQEFRLPRAGGLLEVGNVPLEVGALLTDDPFDLRDLGRRWVGGDAELRTAEDEEALSHKPRGWRAPVALGIVAG